MEINCGSCSASLSIPDDKLPKGVPVIKANCPKCQYPLEIHIPQPGDAPAAAPQPAPAPAAAAPPPAPAPAPAPASDSPEANHTPKAPPAEAPAPARPAASPVAKAPEEQPAPPPATEDFSEERKLAMACFADPGLLALATEGLEAAGYSVHVPAKSVDALHWLRRGKYELVLIHEGFDARFLSTLQPMAMSMRRHLCIGLVGPSLQTFDNMAAFAKSVNFVAAERELDKIKGIARQALADNDQFYRIFREAVHDAGKV